ncbi:MAG: SufE family protein [Caldilineaceae bacterium]|nr:SufE family protein [Caldilineaceae bacterium]
MSAEELIEDFSFLETWEERFRLIVEMGRELEPMDPADKVDANRMLGCQSRVWITCRPTDENPPRLHFVGDSDAQIVKGLIAVVFEVYNDQTPQTILDTDIRALFAELGLANHLTPSRANGLNSMVERIRAFAAE